MILPVNIGTLPVPAQRILDPKSPTPLKAMAAKGVVPGLKPGDIVTVVALLAESTDPAIARLADQTLGSLPPPILEGALTAELPPGVLHMLADKYLAQKEIIGRLLEISTILPETVSHLAEVGSEAICERIAVNEARLISNPQIIEKLYLNRSTRMSTADRVLELAARNGLTLDIPAYAEAVAAIQQELVAAPSEEPTPDDLLFKQVDALAKGIHVDLTHEDTHVLDDEGNEIVVEKCRPLWVELGTMTVSQKIRRALLGTATERMLLVRDSNRLVATAAIRSPLIQEPEVIRIAGSRLVDDGVLRIIASSKEWTRSYQVKANLAMNPRTPFFVAAKMIPLLRENDLKAIAKSKNVTGAVATAARQHLQRKSGKT